MLARIFPFLEWFKAYDASKFKIDLMAGLTVALVLIPQSMAYAQLAGLPAYFGLYAAFLPPMMAALFGSSRQLSTGPVAVVSLMTAAALEPLATLGSQEFITYAVVLSLTVGIFQLSLGIFRLGLIVNFLAHPVVNGFSNAAALIIASSQLSKLFGVDVDNAAHHYETVIRVVQAAINYTHWPTLVIGLFSIAIMVILKRLNPRIPNVLVAVVVTTLIAWGTGFEHNRKVDISCFESTETQERLLSFNAAMDKVAELGVNRTETSKKISALEEVHGGGLDKLTLTHQLNMIQMEMETEKHHAHTLRETLRNTLFRAVTAEDGKMTLYLKEKTPEGAKTDGRIWRIRLGNKRVNEKEVVIMGGGGVVGSVPKGLPTLGIPQVKTAVVLKLLPAAIIISLLGFMEAIAIAKAMASKTGQRIDPNQELIGQGVANIMGSIGQSYPTSGSFSRSAVNLQSGAVTGLSSVITSIVVVIALLFLTPLLYHLPNATLAAVIMMAVIGLLNVSGFVHAWKTQWYDGAISIITFIFTLVFAPHLEKGIYVGVVLSLGMFLYKSMRPKISSLSRHEDESLREIGAHQLAACEYIDLIRFEGPLFFANASYLEEEIDSRIVNRKNLKHIIIAANGINDIDTSGEETLALIVDRLRSSGYGISLSGVNETVMAVLKRTHLFENIGGDNIFPTMEKAIRTVYDQTHRDSQEKTCPLLTTCRHLSDVKN